MIFPSSAIRLDPSSLTLSPLLPLAHPASGTMTIYGLQRHPANPRLGLTPNLSRSRIYLPQIDLVNLLITTQPKHMRSDHLESQLLIKPLCPLVFLINP